MKKVKFKIKIGIRNKGDEVEYSDAIADGMEKHGFADIIGEVKAKPKEKAKPISKDSFKK